MTDWLRCVTVWLFCGLITVSLSGCGPSYDGPPRAEISGSVSVDGQPLADGVLNLVPDGHDGRSASVPVAAGRYFIQEVDGPNLGKYKVEIYGFGDPAAAEDDDEGDPGGDEWDREKIASSAENQVIPAKFNVETQLVLDVNEAVVRNDWNLTR